MGIRPGVALVLCGALALTGCGNRYDKRIVRAQCAMARPTDSGTARQLTLSGSVHAMPGGQLSTSVVVRARARTLISRSPMTLYVYDGDRLVAVGVPGVPGSTGIGDAVGHVFLTDAHGRATDSSVLATESCVRHPPDLAGLSATVSYTLLSDTDATVGILVLDTTVQ